VPPSAVTRPGTRPAGAASGTGASQTDAGEPGSPAAREEDKPATRAAATPSAASATKAGEPAQEAGDAQPAAAAAESPASEDDLQVSVVPGITRYHLGNCQLIRFLSADDLELMTRRAATESGCVPCKACKPDQVGADVPVG
jgi:hypothetical protein